MDVYTKSNISKTVALANVSPRACMSYRYYVPMYIFLNHAH